MHQSRKLDLSHGSVSLSVRRPPQTAKQNLQLALPILWGRFLRYLFLNALSSHLKSNRKGSDFSLLTEGPLKLILFDSTKNQICQYPSCQHRKP